MRVFEGKHSQDWAEIAENEEICDLHDKNGGLRFFWQLVQLNYALVSQMGCLELFIFENGQPMTTPPPKVYFWAFRLTVDFVGRFRVRILSSKKSYDIFVVHYLFEL